MLAYLFPGQGSQTQGMGKDLFDLFPELIRQADEILGYSIVTLCLQNPEQQLHNTLYTQPAIYIINCLSYLKVIQEHKQKPDFVAGHSLGEYSALFAAEIFDFATGLNLVKKRAELMNQANDGSMLAIIGLDIHQVQDALQRHQLLTINIANYNSYQQIVISGLKADIQQAINLFSKISSVKTAILNVSGAFHSIHMQTAQQNYSTYLPSFNFATPTLPVIANVNAQPYHPAVTCDHLTKQLSNTVQWTKTIEYLLNQGVINFTEIGCGNTLTGLVRRISNGE